MNLRFSHGVMALLASTALTTAHTAHAQDSADNPETAQETVEDDALRQSTIVIRGAFIPDEKRSTSEISSLLDAGDFALQGDGDVAAALRRVTGVSIADSKFVYVRGLNERYSSSTLNGSPLPSPEPLRRVAPLDLFPTSVLRSLLVQKTYSPEYSAEFGGGNVDIRTKALPDEGFFEVGVSTGVNSETSFQDGLLYDGGDTDWLGVDDGTRDYPGNLGALLANGQYQSQDLAVRSGLSAGLVDNPSLLVLQEGYVGPDYGVNLSGGDRYEVTDGISMGVLAAGSFSNEWSTRQGTTGNNFLLTADSIDTNYSDRYSTTNNIAASGLASVGFDLFDDHEVKFLGFLTRSTDKDAQSSVGVDADSGATVRADSLSWVERELWTTQVQGESLFPSLGDLKASWRGSYSEANRNSPYEFTAGYTQNPAGVFVLQGNGDTSFRFSDIKDDTTDFGIDLVYPLSIGTVTVDLKGGYAYIEKDRESTSFDLRTVNLGNVGLFRIDSALQTAFGPNGFALDAPPSQSSPDYSVATLEVDAAYLAFDAQLTNFLRIALGMRYEDSIEVVETRAFPTGPGSVTPPIEESRYLPAATVTWNFAEDLQFRVGYSETVTRPQFRELSPTFFYNQENDVGYFGNRFLQDAELKNYDARLEYYFARDQFVTVGGFYKDLANVIEEVLTTDENLTTTFVNIPKAELYGFELEYEQNVPIGNWLKSAWTENKTFLIKTNYTWSQSELQYPDGYQIVLTSRTPGAAQQLQDASLYIESGRAMSGQSEHLLNLQFGFKDDAARSEANILLNYGSERIRFGRNLSGARKPTVWEQPPITVDFVYNRDFTLAGGEYSFGLKLENLLDEPFDWYQEAGGTKAIVNYYDIGRSASVSLKRSF